MSNLFREAVVHMRMRRDDPRHLPIFNHNFIQMRPRNSMAVSNNSRSPRAEFEAF